MSRLAIEGMARLGGARVLDAAWRRRLTVLVYHRVTAWDDDFRFDPGLISATPPDFARQMSWIARNFDVLDLDDAVGIIGGDLPCPRRPALITFDDGYRDNRDNALPVLRSLDLPAVVFIITGAIGTDLVPWWDRIAQLIGDAPSGTREVPGLGRIHIDDLASRRRSAEMVAGALKKLPEARRAAIVAELPANLDATPTSPAAPLFMDWDDARALERSRVACQPHTHTHPILTRVDSDAIRQEIAVSSDQIRTKLDRKVKAFAYPNGRPDDINEEIVRLLAQERIEIAFTMDAGPQGLSSARGDPLRVRRISIEASDDLDRFRLKVMGALVVKARLRPHRRSGRQRP